MNAATKNPLTVRTERLGDVKVIGLGGVGSIAARFLVLYLAALARAVRVVLIDGDHFEAKNRERMMFSRPGNKAEVVVEDLGDLVQASSVTLLAVDEYVTTSNLERLVHPGDTVLLAVDNHKTRKLVSAHCAKLEDVCLISAGCDGVGKSAGGHVYRGTYGNVQVYRRRGGRDDTPSLTRFHPEIQNPADKAPYEESCTASYQSVPQLLFTNLAAASAMLNTLQLHLCERLHYPELGFDIHDGRMGPVPLPAEGLDVVDGKQKGDQIKKTKPQDPGSGQVPAA